MKYPETITLPILEAFDYLYERGLTIDKLWAQDRILPEPGNYRVRETHITVKPKGRPNPRGGPHSGP